MVTSDSGNGRKGWQVRTWASPAEVAPGSGVATQIALMRELASGKIAGPDFARSWLAARRRVLDAGERVREKFNRMLTEVFYLLDDYVIDPALRDVDDMTDDELVVKVRAVLDELDALDVLHRGDS